MGSECTGSECTGLHCAGLDSSTQSSLRTVAQKFDREAVGKDLITIRERWFPRVVTREGEV